MFGWNRGIYTEEDDCCDSTLTYSKVVEIIYRPVYGIYSHFRHGSPHLSVT